MHIRGFNYLMKSKNQPGILDYFLMNMNYSTLLQLDAITRSYKLSGYVSWL